MDTNPNFVLQYKEIIVALIAVFGVVVPYLIQRNKEYKLKLVEQKIVAYGQVDRFVSYVSTIAHLEQFLSQSSMLAMMRCEELGTHVS